MASALTPTAFTRTALSAGAALAVILGPVALAGSASAATPAVTSAAATSTASSASTSSALLRTGSRSQSVKAWQQDLNTFRTTLRSPAARRLATDGVYGPATTAATRDFQRYYRGVAADGVVGPNTRARMQTSLAGTNAGSAGTGTATATPPDHGTVAGTRSASGTGTASAGLSSTVLRDGSHGSSVKSWQERLDLYREKVRSPHLSGIATDGAYGPDTTAATEDLQRHAKITVDGVFGPQTLKAYDRLAG